jgi:acetyl esterase/lipase
MKKTLKRITTAVAVLSAGMSALRFFRARSPAGVPLMAPKLLASALAPFLALIGAVSAGVGVLLKAPLAVLAGAGGAGLAADHVRRVLAARGDVAQAFGADWRAWLPPERTTRMLPRRWVGTLPPGPDSRWERDVPFWTLPTTDNADEADEARTLLCDLWLPPDGVAPSGLAFIYLHGSGWHFLDKDVGTRPMFRHLSAQGHVIMDVAYRLCPETDWRGMLGDVQRAVAWMRAHAADYGADPARIVLGGGSAGGHLALLAAYTPKRADLRAADVAEADLSVRGVVSWYGPTDMAVYHTYAGRIFETPVAPEGGDALPDQIAEALNKALGFDMTPPPHWSEAHTVQEAMMRALFGGTPDEIPEVYRQASPITHAGPQSPPTLLLQGEHDAIVSPSAVRSLAERLRAAGAPVVHVAYPETDHAFDLVLPQVSPSAQAALYETERFLALLASGV